MDANAAMTLGEFWPALIAGRQDLAGYFTAQARISYPPAGNTVAATDVAAYLAGTHRWLARQDARWQPVATTAAGTRVVDEGVLALRRESGEVGLPVATVADFDGSQITWLRVYHSMWPLEGRHYVRPPLLQPLLELPLSGAVAQYQDALSRGDLEAILASFGPDAYAREPAGEPYVYRGAEALRRFYSAILSQGGIALEHCTVTDDGVRCAIEYNAVRWGKVAMPPQAGVAVYQRGTDGRLAAARIYDDVDPPVEG